MSNSRLLDAADSLAGVGVSFVATGADKLPTGKWKLAQQEIPGKQYRERNFNGRAKGIATIGGTVSGNLETFDFDVHNGTCLYIKWAGMIREADPDLFALLCISRTPSGGYHVRIRCPGITIPGSTKLATNYKIDPESGENDKRAVITWIESKGEGGYAVCPPSPGYESIQGSLLKIPTITPEQRGLLVSAALSFNHIPKKQVTGQQAQAQEAGGGERPGDVYNREGDCLSVLTKHGWECTREEGSKKYLKRPGGENPWSATFNAPECPQYLYVFSSNADPFEPETAYSPFAVYAFLEHDKDFAAAAKDLASQGYGTERQEEAEKKAKREREKREKAIERLRKTGKNLLQKKIPKLDIHAMLLQGNHDEMEPAVIDEIVDELIPKLKPRNALEIASAEYPDPNWAIPDILGEGLTVFAGPSKIGKSWMVLDWGIAIARGDKALGSIDVEQHDVLYCALEDSDRRLKGRLDVLLPGILKPDKLHFITMGELPLIDMGGLDMLSEYVSDYPNTRLIIIDTWKKCKPFSTGRRNAYDEDYEMLGVLQQFAMSRQLALIVVHHTRKGADPDNVLNEVSGSTGMQAPADGIIILRREGGGFTLKITGRDVEEQELAVAFEGGKWRTLGDASEHRMSKERKQILGVITEQARLGDIGEPMTPANIASILGYKPANVRRLLYSMVTDGDIIKTGRVYCMPGSTSNGNAGNVGNIGNAGNVGNAQEDSPPGGDKNVTAGESGNAIGNASESPNASGSKSSSKNVTDVTDVTDDNKVVQMTMPLTDERLDETDKRFLKSVGQAYGKISQSDCDFLSAAKDAGYDLGDERHQEDALRQILDKLTGLGTMELVQGGRRRLVALPAKDVGGE